MRHQESGPLFGHHRNKNDREKEKQIVLWEKYRHIHVEGIFYHFICFNIHVINFRFKQKKGTFLYLDKFQMDKSAKRKCLNHEFLRTVGSFEEVS